jgi:hypothetical protein
VRQKRVCHTRLDVDHRDREDEKKELEMRHQVGETHERKQRRTHMEDGAVQVVHDVASK